MHSTYLKDSSATHKAHYRQLDLLPAAKMICKIVCKEIILILCKHPSCEKGVALCKKARMKKVTKSKKQISVLIDQRKNTIEEIFDIDY